MLVSNSATAQKAKHLTTTAKIPHAYEYIHDEIGYNFRMPNLNAALGVPRWKARKICFRIKEIWQWLTRISFKVANTNL